MIATLLLFLILQAVNPLQMLREDPDRAGVCTHPYEFRECRETAAPKGYKPFYLSHYGRHGSRTEWGLSSYRDVEKVLEKARQEGFLSAKGDSLLSETRIVIRVHDGMNGHLTRRGEEEHRILADRLYARYPRIFKKGSRLIRVESSTVPRCLVSMASFTTELARIQPSLRFTMDSGEKQYGYISNEPSKEHRRAVLDMLDSMNRTIRCDSTHIYATLFTDPVAGKALAPDPEKFQKEIWDVARIARASGIRENVFRYLPEDVIYRWWDYYNRQFYMWNGNSVEFGDERIPRVHPLVRDIIEKADDAIQSASVAADLKFGHDFPLLSLAGFFGLDGVGQRLSFEEIPEKWVDPVMIPFASNFQIVFYRSCRKGSDILVKFIYNDRERALEGLSPVYGPYYRWEDIKTFCEAKMR